MTSVTKKQSTPKPMRLVDEQNPVFASLENLTQGMTPEQAAMYRIEFVEAMDKRKAEQQAKSQSRQKIP